MTDIAYPSGCRPLTEDLGTDELLRRLKTLAHTLQGMHQDDGHYQQYIPLALHLVDDFFLQHNSRDVQLLVACCIADVLRVYAPEAPYKDQEQIKTIFLFFIRQLHGLRDPKDPSFKRYFYLLENLAYVKTFNMCFDIEDSQKVFNQLFSMIFKIVNEEHSNKVKNFMIDILSPLISEADNFTAELLDLILINIVEPYKSQNKYAYQLAEQLIIKTSDSLEPIIKLFFNQVLVMDKVDKNLAISSKVYDLIYELNLISPNILTSVLPQLECKIKSTSDTERLKAVSLLARMFSEKDSQLSTKHPNLLRMFFGRFCDISVAVRVKCVQSSMHFLLNHPHLRQEVSNGLRSRQHDPEETVRYEVVMAIVETAKRDFTIVCESEELLDYVRERMLDKKFKIRKEAMIGLALIYKKAVCEPNDLSDEIKNSVDWIKNKVLHGYYMSGLEDRLLVERLLIACLVPYKLPPEERMKKLYHLLGTLDANATKAFIELQKNQMKTRKTVSDWIKLHHSKELTKKVQDQLNIKLNTICKLLPDPIRTSEFLNKFSQEMRKDTTLLRYMDTILKRDISCKECAEHMSALLKKLGSPVAANIYYNTVKMLIERIASVMVDKESIEVLIGLVENCIQHGNVVKEIGIPRSEAGESGLRLLAMLSYVFSAHFFTDTSLRHLIALLSYEEEYVAPLVLKTLSHLGRYKPLAIVSPFILEELAPVCKEFALTGTAKQAKHAVRCIFVNSQTHPLTAADSPFATTTTTNANTTNKIVVHPIFKDIIENLRTSLNSSTSHLHTKIVTLGHIALNMAQAFLVPVKNMIARRIVKDLLIQPLPETREETLPTGDWCPEEELPELTLCKLDALKTMARWLLGLRNDEHAAPKTFRMLSAFIIHHGDLLEQNRLCSAERSWLRLGAANAMLKVCEQKGVGDQYSVEQYFLLSQVILDTVPEVRENFARKLHKGLGKGLPNKCLPIDFMGFYALAGYETDKRLSDLIRHYMDTDVNRRREYLKNITATSSEGVTVEQTWPLVPDFMLAFAIPVLVHDPQFTNYEDRQQLKQVEKCLRFVLEPFMAKRDTFCYSFYKNLIEMLKNHEDVIASTATDEIKRNAINCKLWAACDLAMYIINSKIGNCTSSPADAFPMPVQLPSMFYRPAAEEDFQNTKIYIPLDTYSLISSATTTGNTKNGALTTSATNVVVMASSHKKPVASDNTTTRSADKRAITALSIDENTQENSDISLEDMCPNTSEPLTKRKRNVQVR